MSLLIRQAALTSLLDGRRETFKWHVIFLMQSDKLQLRYHAQQTLIMLEDPLIDRFAEVFLRDHLYCSAGFDEYLQ